MHTAKNVFSGRVGHLKNEQSLYHRRTIARAGELLNYLIINSFTNWHSSSF